MFNRLPYRCINFAWLRISGGFGFPLARRLHDRVYIDGDRGCRTTPGWRHGLHGTDPEFNWYQDARDLLVAGSLSSGDFATGRRAFGPR